MGEGEGRRRVVVGVSGSLGSLAALHRAAYEARRGGADLLAVLAWQPPGGDIAHRRAMIPSPVADFRRAAGRRLLAALDTAFGDAGPRVPFQGLVVRGSAGPALVEIAGRADDLLVVGAGAAAGYAAPCSPPSPGTASRTPAAPSWPFRPRPCRANSPPCTVGSACGCRSTPGS